MEPELLYRRYCDLQRYVNWTDDDTARIRKAESCVAPAFPQLIDDFYEEIQRHAESARILTGGEEQIARLKGLLHGWLVQLFAGPYDLDYVVQRWRVGQRHAKIGLDQTYASVALARLRNGILSHLCSNWSGNQPQLLETIQSVNRLLDLDLVIIEDSYQAEYVAQRQQAERDRMSGLLHEEREFSGGLLSKAQAAIVVLDLQGRVMRFNPYTEALCGFSLEQAQGEDWFERFLTPDDRPRIRNVFEQTVLEGETTGVVGTLANRSGEQRRLLWSCQALKDAAGQTFAVLAVGHDITELEQAQQRALQAQRLATIGQMAAALAHEGRNALQRIQANTETLELELEQQPESLELVARIQRAQEDLRRLFDEIRGFAAPVNLDRSECSLASVWREAWDLLAAQRKGREARLIEDLDDMDLTGAIDHFRVVQVFRNLLENSLAACPDPVEIRISCTPAELAGRPAIRALVCDNGPGIPPEHRKRVFEPFFSTKTKGIGLGMAIARRTIEAHGGTIEVGDSTPSGARIIVTLPKAPIEKP